MAASEDRQEAGSKQYKDNHFGKILKQGFSFSGFERDHLWWNDGAGSFVDISGLSGIDSPTDGRGAAYGDLDNDGDLDIVRTSLQGRTHFLYRNNVGSSSGHLRVTLQGMASGRDAWGTVVRVTTSHGTLTRMKSGGSGYVSSSDPRLLFGLGDDKRVKSVDVQWPSGTRESFGAFPAGTSLLIVEGSGRAEVLTEGASWSLPDPPGAAETMAAMLRVNVGDKFPDLEIVTASGDATTVSAIREAKGVTLVNLWATWCVPCRREMPALQKLHEEFGQDGLAVLGLSLDTGAARKQVPRVAKKLGVTYPVFTSETPVYPHIFSGEEVFIPLSYVVDASGTVLEVIGGWSSDAEQRVRKLLD